MIRCAVVGNPISHSLSPQIHQLFAEQAGLHTLIYEKIQAEDANFHSLVKDFFAGGGKGLNITLPFKEHAFRIADRTTHRCAKAKAANTLWMQNNLIFADNTDGIGLIKDVDQHIDLRAKRILILGAGGATRGIIEPLLEAGIAKLCVANRTIEKCYQLAESFPIMCMELTELGKTEEPFDLIIHATSMGLKNVALNLPKNLWFSKPLCYDLSYNIAEPTAFVAAALAEGCRAVDGLGMLIEQAAEAFNIWHDFVPDTLPILKNLRVKPQHSS